jgi:hypothetical protein
MEKEAQQASPSSTTKAPFYKIGRKGRQLRYTALIVNQAGVTRTTTFFSEIRPVYMTCKKAVGFLGRNEVRGERIVTVYPSGNEAAETGMKT